jgi:hypothetical protein
MITNGADMPRSKQRVIRLSINLDRFIAGLDGLILSTLLNRLSFFRTQNQSIVFNLMALYAQSSLIRLCIAVISFIR